MIILAIEERDVTDFDRYLAGGHQRPAHGAWIVLSNMGRFLRQDPSHQIVSVQDIPARGVADHQLVVIYLAGHGNPGTIGVTHQLAARIIQGHVTAAFERSPEAVKSCHRIFISSCNAARQVAPPGSSVTDAVTQAFEEVKRRHPGVITGPLMTVQGCRGSALSHPDPTWPIVQVDPGRDSEYTKLQEGLERKHAVNIAEANRLIQEMMGRAQGMNPRDKMALLRTTAKRVAELTEPFYTELITTAWENKLLSKDAFAPDGRIGSLVRDDTGKLNVAFPTHAAWIPASTRLARGLQQPPSTPPSIPDGKGQPLLEVVGHGL